MALLFALTLFVGATLLFSIQPMIAKMILPLLGGSPSVWSICMMFFQAALLAGYAYAHATTAWLGVRRQAVVHAALLLLPLGMLPLGLAHGFERSLPGLDNPTIWLLGVLILGVGLPFFVVATTAPLLQRWFADLGHPSAHDPYFLYGASNLGSLLILLSYPLVIEPNWRLAEQSAVWSVGYGVLVLLTWACAWTLWRRPTPVLPRAVAERDQAGDSPSHWRAGNRWTGWVALAFVPSSLMLGVTTYLSTDVAAVPLLWIVPLALYLLTFILAFARKPIIPHLWTVRVLPVFGVMLAFILGFGLVKPWLIPVHLLAFFVAALFCHGELARRRPPTRDLTSFYLAIAVGGALGGIFNSLVAPLVFDRVTEYPLALVLACLALSGTSLASRSPREVAAELVLPLILFLLVAALATDFLHLFDTLLGALGVFMASGLSALVCLASARRPLRFALGLGAVLAASGLTAGVEGRVLHQERSFFGVLRVTHASQPNTHRLFHGHTLHGEQYLEAARRLEPTSYYFPSGPVGQLFEAFHQGAARHSVAVCGLGAGALTCYARPLERWTIYEIDPAVVRLARDSRYFTFLRDCRAQSVSIVLGDARLRLGDAPAHEYGLIILDAFSSDAVPVHLLTREALRLYRGKLARGGLIAFNISTRYLDLDPVLASLARDAELVYRIRFDLEPSPDEKRIGKQPTIWAVMAACEADLGLLVDDLRWRLARPSKRIGDVWADDFSNVIEHLTIWPRARDQAAR